MKRLSVVLLLSSLFMGCAGTTPEPRTLEQLNALLPELEARMAADPGNADAQAAYGLALYQLRRNDDAELHLREALTMDSEQAAAAVALATLLKARGDLSGALAVCGEATPQGKEDVELVRAESERIRYALLREQMVQLARTERERETTSRPDGTLAVETFASDHPDPNLQHLGKAVAVMLTTDLATLPGLRMVERQRFSVLQDELALAQATVAVEGKSSLPDDLDPITEVSGLQQRLAVLRPSPEQPPFYVGAADGLMGPGTRTAIRDFQAWAGLDADGVPGPATHEALEDALVEAYPAPVVVVDRDTAPRAGLLLGAEKVLSGRVEQASMLDVAVRASFVDVESGESRVPIYSSQRLDEFYRLSADLTLQTADGWGIQLTPEQRQALLQKPPPTRSLSAFLAFGHGVDLEDKGRLDEAAEAYGEALRLDPQFSMARERVEVWSTTSASFQQSIQRTTQAALRTVSGSRATLANAMGAVGTGVQEDDVRTDDKNDRTAQASGPPEGSVQVGGQIPVPKP